VGCSLTHRQHGFNLSSPTPQAHAPGRWLVLRPLSQIAHLQAASLPPARSLRMPGSLGDAVGRLLPQFALNLYRALFVEPLFALTWNQGWVWTWSLMLQRCFEHSGCINLIIVTPRGHGSVNILSMSLQVHLVCQEHLTEVAAEF
jgi:hypothetical protein